MNLLAAELACHRGGRAVFAGLSFEVAAGEALIILGRNGAGKTSLLRLIAGLLRPAGGQIVLHGGDRERTLPEQSHYLGHQDAVKPALSVRENLEFWTRYFGGGDIAPALEEVGLAAIADLPAAYLSTGQRRRLSFARLLAAARPIWLLDEPTASLDDSALAWLDEAMRAHRADGGIIVSATHGPLGLANAKELRLEEAAAAAAATTLQ